MRIILARHADATNQDGVFHGMKDTALTRAGYKEAEELADELLQYKPALIYTSDRQRAKDTAYTIGQELNVPVRIAKELRPLDLGDFVGKKIDDYLDEVKYFLSNPEETIPGGESVDHWANTYLPFFDRLFKHKSNETVVFVTHGRNIVLTRAHLKANLNGFDKNELANNKTTTEHAGVAIAQPPNKFEIVDAKTVKPGQS